MTEAQPCLCFAVILTTAFGLLIKLGRMRGWDILALGAVNYLVGGLAGTAYVLAVAAPPPGGLAVLIALPGGALFALSYLMIIVLVRREGISLPVALVNLSLVLQVGAAMVIWPRSEIPTPIQFAGLGLVLPGLWLLAVPGRALAEVRRPGVSLAALVLFVSSGVTRVLQLAFEKECPPADRPGFTAVWFLAAAAVTLGMLAVRRRRPGRPEWLGGIVLGLVNLGALVVILLALRELPGTVVFPVISCAWLVLTPLLAWLFWRETLTRRTIAGIALAVAAIVLLNL